MPGDDSTDSGIAAVLAVSIAALIALFAIGIAVFLSGEPARRDAAAAPAHGAASPPAQAHTDGPRPRAGLR